MIPSRRRARPATHSPYRFCAARQCRHAAADHRRDFSANFTGIFYYRLPARLMIGSNARAGRWRWRPLNLLTGGISVAEDDLLPRHLALRRSRLGFRHDESPGLSHATFARFRLLFRCPYLISLVSLPPPFSRDSYNTPYIPRPLFSPAHSAFADKLSAPAEFSARFISD